jgi:dTDP-4-dehydrorhamnose 3,5-epimerase-like enzyme
LKKALEITMKKIEDNIEIISRNKIEDKRGWFIKVVDGNETLNPFPCEVYITSAKAGESKGGHYHELANEWFILIKGEAILLLENVKTKERKEIKLNANSPNTIFVPPLIAHSFLNIGKKENIVLAYTDKKYKPEDTITYNML